MNINEKESVVKAILNNDVDYLNKISKQPNFDINAPLVSNEKFIMHACIKSVNTEILKWFIDNHADINCQNEQGISPLIIATIHQNIEAIKLLISHEANLEFQYKLTKANPNLVKTALELAIDKKDNVIIQQLILSGAKTDYLELSNNSTHKRVKEIIKLVKEKNQLENNITSDITGKKNKL